MLAAREGTRQEDWIVEDLRKDYGYTIWDRQREYTIRRPRFEIVFHIDGEISQEDMEPHLLEIKTFNEGYFDLFVRYGLEFFPKYEAQISIYMSKTGLPCLVVGKNRGSGKMVFYQYPVPPLHPKILLAKILSIENAVREDELLPCDGVRDIFCPYPDLCENKRREDAKITEIEDDGVLRLVEEYAQVKPQSTKAAKEAQSLRAGILDQLWEGGFTAGKYGVRISRMGNRTFNQAKARELLSENDFEECFTAGEYFTLRVWEK